MSTRLTTGEVAKDKIVEAALKWSRNPSLYMAELLAAVDDFKTGVWEADCYQNLQPDELAFTLMARDPDFYITIRTWAFSRTMQIENGVRKDTPEERLQIKQALETGRKGAQWRDAWMLQKEMSGLVFNHEGYPINGPNAVNSVERLPNGTEVVAEVEPPKYTYSEDDKSVTIERLPTSEQLAAEVKT